MENNIDKRYDTTGSEAKEVSEDKPTERKKSKYKVAFCFDIHIEAENADQAKEIAETEFKLILDDLKFEDARPEVFSV